MPAIKIITLGVENVGKSVLIKKFITGTFIDKYVPTIEDAFQTTSNVNGKALQVEILDNSGNDKYQVLCEANLPSADGFLLVYSIEDRTSFESLKIIHKKILQFHNEQIPIVIVGNKLDLEKKSRRVSTEEGNSLAQDLSAFYFYEVSAKTSENMEEAFSSLVNAIVATHPDAGLDDGPGGVFGAGLTASSNEKKKTARGDMSHQASYKGMEGGSGSRHNSNVSQGPPPPIKGKRRGCCTCCAIS